MTLVQVLIVLAVIAAVAAVAAGVVRGGLEEPASSLPDVGLPDGELQGSDLTDVRFSLGLRGYRMDEVDRVLDRAAAELDARDLEIARLRGELDGSSGAATVVGFPATDATTDAVTHDAMDDAAENPTDGDPAMATGSTAVTARDA